MNPKTKLISSYGLLTALALVLSYLESLIPAFFALPGMKLGLTNIVVMVALYRLGPKQALAINFIRILLVGLMFSNGVSFLYSLAGGLLSGLLMILLKQTKHFHLITVSIVGGIAHNIGQILCAILLLGTASLGWYLCILWISGLLTGMVIGLISSAILVRLPKEL